MIKSMTGFGRCEAAWDNRKFTVEIKAVNHRYLEINVKMPKALNFFESAVRSELKKYISRGKVDVFVAYEDLSETTIHVRYNREVAREYLRYCSQMAEEFSLENDISVSKLSRFPEVLIMEETGADEEELWKELLKALTGAAQMFVDSRIEEGEHLKADLIDKLDGMHDKIVFIEEHSPQIVTAYRSKLDEKVRDLLADAAVDENRLLTEVIMFADKVCVDEEIVRLRSHIETTKNTLADGGEMGRKLDFIAQEMNREATTILSKINDLECSNCAIDLKTDIEKVREQIQNIE